MNQGYIFVSYAREDHGFVAELVERLRLLGREAWVDRRIRPGDKWEDVIGERIRGAVAVLLVASGHSTRSPAVHKELAMAGELGRAVIPVALEPWSELPSAWSGLQGHPWRGDWEFLRRLSADLVRMESQGSYDTWYDSASEGVARYRERLQVTWADVSRCIGSRGYLCQNGSLRIHEGMDTDDHGIEVAELVEDVSDRAVIRRLDEALIAWSSQVALGGATSEYAGAASTPRACSPSPGAGHHGLTGRLRRGQVRARRTEPSAQGAV